MRISDWSSDVCSSDLMTHQHMRLPCTDSRIKLPSLRITNTLKSTNNINTSMNVQDATASAIRCDRCLRSQVRPARNASHTLMLGTFFNAKCGNPSRSEEHTSELQSLMRISYAVFSLTNKHIRNIK